MVTKDYRKGVYEWVEKSGDLESKSRDRASKAEDFLLFTARQTTDGLGSGPGNQHKNEEN